jgi:hypothetical protein
MVFTGFLLLIVFSTSIENRKLLLKVAIPVNINIDGHTLRFFLMVTGHRFASMVKYEGTHFFGISIASLNELLDEDPQQNWQSLQAVSQLIKQYGKPIWWDRAIRVAFLYAIPFIIGLVLSTVYHWTTKVEVTLDINPYLFIAGVAYSLGMIIRQIYNRYYRIYRRRQFITLWSRSYGNVQYPHIAKTLAISVNDPDIHRGLWSYYDFYRVIPKPSERH